MPRVVVGDLVTGRRITDVPYVSYAWSVARNQYGRVSCRLPMYDPDVAALGLSGVATPGKAYLAVIEDGDLIPNAGRLADPGYDWDEMQLELTAPGIRSVLKKRSILPPAALTVDPTQFVIPDPADATKTIPNPALATTLSGMDHGSIGFSIVRQALSWPGGQLPVVIPANRAGTRTETWDGIELKGVDEALGNLSGQLAGPDFAFTPQLQADRQGVEWLMEAGTETQPVLTSDAVHRVDLTVREPVARRLETSSSVDRMGSLGWAVGGRAADRALIARDWDPYLIDAGYPLQEIVDSSHNDVTNQDTLTGYAREATRAGRTASQFWSFEIRKEVWAQWRMKVGGQCLLIVRGDPWVPDGDHMRDIAAMGGDEGDWVKITTAEV